MQTTLQQDIETIYRAMGWTNGEGLDHLPDPLAEDETGRAARWEILEWAMREGYMVHAGIHPDGAFTFSIGNLLGHRATRDASTPLEAFLRSLAAAVRAFPKPTRRQDGFSTSDMGKFVNIDNKRN